MTPNRVRRLVVRLTVSALAALSWLGVAVGPSHASVVLSYTASIISADSHRFASAEIGWNGSYPDVHGITRTRSAAAGPWERFDIVYAHDTDSTAPYHSTEGCWSGGIHSARARRSRTTSHE